MPRISSDGSDDDASSEYDSDSSSSVHTIYNALDDASRQWDAANQASDYSNNFAPQPSPTVPASGHGSNGQKRKADDYGDQGHSHAPGTKSRRLTSTRSSTSASDSSASSEAENGYYDDNDIYPPLDAAVAAPGPGPAPPMHPAFLKSSSSTLPKRNDPPKTGAQLWAEHFPNIEIEGKARTDVLSALPVRRVPTIVGPFKVNTKPQNMAAWFIQASGDVLPTGKACTRCAEGLGVFGPTCVVMAGGDMHKKTLNTCANCWYNRMGFCCSVRVGVRKRQSTNQRSTVAHYHGQKQQPAIVAPPSQGSMVHPAYASSSNTASSWEPFPGAAAATPAHAPTGGHNLVFPTTAHGLLTSMGHPPPIHVVTAAAKSLPPPPPPQLKLSSSPPTTVLTNSLDGKVGSWEKRYENMNTTELVEMQRVLVERLEDTTMRMVAMQKVLAARQAGGR